MADNELEKLYMPSMWSKRYSADEIVEVHKAIMEKATEQARRDVPNTLNISYGPKNAEKYDLYGTNLPKDAPIFVYIHGGYWQILSKELSGHAVKPLVKIGFKVAVIGYTLAPQASVAEICDEVKAAVTKLVEYAKEQGSCGIYIAGHSVGGHLAATLLEDYIQNLSEDKKLIKSLFLICGIYDVTPVVFTTANEPLHLTEESARAVSPQFKGLEVPEHVTVYVFAAENDSPAFVKQSELFYEKLKGLGVKAHYKFIPELDHFNITEDLQRDDNEIIGIIKKESGL